MDRWHQVWERKGTDLDLGNDAGLIDLIRANGFDHGPGAHTLESWVAFCKLAQKRLRLDVNSRVLDVGCGCGAFTYTAYQSDCDITGVDYSFALLRNAVVAMPEGNFLQAGAGELPFRDDHFDVTVCHSVFQYFPSEQYARTAVEEMCRVSRNIGGRLAILDINDEEKERLFYKVRRREYGGADYDKKYKDFPHRFYARAWFERLFSEFGYRVEIYDQDIAGYANSEFRFNVFAFSDD